MPSKVAKPLVDQLVRANSKIDGPAIKRTLKTAGLDMGIRDIQRAKKALVDVSKEEEADAISRLPAFFEAIERDCPGSVATIEVSLGESPLCGQGSVYVCVARGLPVGVFRAQQLRTT